MRRHMLMRLTPLLVLLAVGCETPAYIYARDAERYQQLAQQYAAAGDFENAAEMQRQSRRAARIAAQKDAEAAYWADHEQKQLPVKSMPAENNLPGP